MITRQLEGDGQCWYRLHVDWWVWFPITNIHQIQLVFTYIHTYIHTVHTYIHTYIYTYIHTYIYTVHTYIHTYCTYTYSGTSIIRTPINRTLDYPNTKLTAQLGYFVNKCMLY